MNRRRGKRLDNWHSWRQKMRAMSASSAPLHFYVCLHVQYLSFAIAIPEKYEGKK